MRREDSYHVHCHSWKPNHSKPNSETRLVAQNVPERPGNARIKNSSQIPREAPAKIVRGIYTMMAPAAPVPSRLVAVEARNLTRSSVHRFIRAMSMGEGAGVVLRDMSPPLMRHSAPVLLLERWSHPAVPGIVPLIPRMFPLLWLQESTPLLLPLECLLLMVLWALLLPWMHLLRTILLLVATSTVVVVLG